MGCPAISLHPLRTFEILRTMPRPTFVKYDELSGDEIKHILLERFKTILDDVPYLQKHLTLPRVQMNLNITLLVYADQPTPEVLQIQDKFDIQGDMSFDGPPVKVEIEDQVSSAPKGGQPADQVREEHGLPVHRAVPQRDSRGEHVVVVDLPDGGQQHVQIDAEGKDPHYQFAKPGEQLEGNTVSGLGGMVVDRTGAAAQETGMPTTRVVLDQGRAGLKTGQMNRQNFGLNGRSPRDR
jgi:hypothetical protein